MRSPLSTIVTGLALPILLIGALAAPALSQDENGSSESKPKEDLFYVLGVALSDSLKPFMLSEDELKEVQRGLKDGTVGSIDGRGLVEYREEITALKKRRMQKAAAMEKVKSEKFVEQAGKKKGARTTSSGLIITTIDLGSGASPSPEDTVKVHYHGTLRDGQVFDSSVERGQPAEFPLNRVIPCWTEGVGMMKVGEKAELICPAGIAYGDRGSPPKIPGGAALTFEVELIEIKSAEAASTP
jgi:FKBP-type peptidyl-prolyl cis-trans isomerase FkpA